MATPSNSLWIKVSHTKTAINFYPKADVTWEQMDAWLERMYGKDQHVSWRGLGADEDFCVVVFRKPCAPSLCTCRTDE